MSHLERRSSATHWNRASVANFLEQSPFQPCRDSGTSSLVSHARMLPGRAPTPLPSDERREERDQTGVQQTDHAPPNVEPNEAGAAVLARGLGGEDGRTWVLAACCVRCAATQPSSFPPMARLPRLVAKRRTARGAGISRGRPCAHPTTRRAHEQRNAPRPAGCGAFCVSGIHPDSSPVRSKGLEPPTF
jgi:hypothetical protein